MTEMVKKQGRNGGTGEISEKRGETSKITRKQPKDPQPGFRWFQKPSKTLYGDFLTPPRGAFHFFLLETPSMSNKGSICLTDPENAPP